VKFRDHPYLIRKDEHRVWPPTWTPANVYWAEKPYGEIGILEDVVNSHLCESKIFLFMRHRGHPYIAELVFDDPEICRIIFTNLEDKVGFSIKEIGDLDLSHTL